MNPKVNLFQKTQIYNKYIITFLFAIINAAFNFWFFRIALKGLGEESFYYYSYSRRIIAFFSPVLMLGIGVGLPRYIGIYYKYKRDVSILLNSSFLIVAIASILWLLINLLFNNVITETLWGEVSELTHSLNLSICLYLVALCLWAVIHSYLRGLLQVILSGFMLLISDSLLPFLAFNLMPSLNWVYNFISIFLLIAIAIVMFLLYKQKKILPRPKVVVKLLQYGIKRIPGDLALSLLVFLPSFFAVTFLNIEYAGIISFSGAILTLCSIPASAISFNILSRSSFLYLHNKRTLRVEVVKIIIGGIIYSLLAYISLVYLIDILILWFMDEILLKYLDIIKYYLIAIPPYILFVLTRSIIDGTKIKAYNSINLVISLLVFLCFGIYAAINISIYTIIIGIIAAYFVLAILSIIRVFIIFRE